MLCSVTPSQPYHFLFLQVTYNLVLEFLSWNVVLLYVIPGWIFSLKALYSPNSSLEGFRFEQSKQTTARNPDSGLNWRTTKFSRACSIEVDTPLRAPDWTWKFSNSHLLQQPLLCVWSTLEKPQRTYSFGLNSYFAIELESIWVFYFYFYFFIKQQ